MKIIQFMLGILAIFLIGFLGSEGSFIGFCITLGVVILYTCVFDFGDDDDYPCK